MASEIFFAAGAKSVDPGVYGIKEFTSPSDIAQMFTRRLKANDFEMMAFHPLGTARMGELAGHSVVDSFGMARGLENLFISDGSIFPTSLGVNPQITIMSFSMRNAEYIVDNKKRFLT